MEITSINYEKEKYILDRIGEWDNSNLKIEDVDSLVFLDLKKVINEKFELPCKHNFDRIMLYFATIFTENEIVALEQRNPAKAIYKRLNWDEEIYNNGEKYYDVINSFWTIYTCGAVIETSKIENKSVNHASYFFQEKNRVMMLIQSNRESPFFKANKYASKYLKLPGFLSGKGFYDIAKKTQNVEGILELAGLCHCVANFMPCPTEYEIGKLSFNQLKGCLYDVKDFLPLMIDKIQQCILLNTELKYGDNDKKKISMKTLYKWRDWFICNRERYMLEEYYSIEEDTNGNQQIIGIPMFKKQSLLYTIPRTEDELIECLNEMNRRIKARGLRMINKLLLEGS